MSYSRAQSRRFCGWCSTASAISSSRSSARARKSRCRANSSATSPGKCPSGIVHPVVVYMTPPTTSTATCGTSPTGWKLKDSERLEFTAAIQRWVVADHRVDHIGQEDRRTHDPDHARYQRRWNSSGCARSPIQSIFGPSGAVGSEAVKDLARFCFAFDSQIHLEPDPNLTLVKSARCRAAAFRLAAHSRSTSTSNPKNSRRIYKAVTS